MPTLIAQSRRLEYRLIPASRPQLPPLVLLHEGLGSLAQWRLFPDRLAAVTGAAVLAYSRWGHGRSERLDGPRPTGYMHREALASLPEILDRLGIENPVLVGHSDGASIALIYAGGSGRAVRGLVLIAPHVFVEEKTVEAIAKAAEAYRTGDLSARLRPHHDDADAMFRGWSEVWLSPAFRRWDITEHLAGITCPILLIQGTDDEYGSAAQLAAIEKCVASRSVARLLLPGCGHAPHRERPDAVLTALGDFVAAVGTPGSESEHRPGEDLHPDQD